MPDSLLEAITREVIPMLEEQVRCLPEFVSSHYPAQWLELARQRLQ